MDPRLQTKPDQSKQASYLPIYIWDRSGWLLLTIFLGVLLFVISGTYLESFLVKGWGGQMPLPGDFLGYTAWAIAIFLGGLALSINSIALATAGNEIKQLKRSLESVEASLATMLELHSNNSRANKMSSGNNKSTDTE